MTDELLMAVTVNASAEVYKKILGFLKEYVVYHFRDEEAYQQSIGYAGFEAHQREHQQFTQTVLAYEKKLIAKTERKMFHNRLIQMGTYPCRPSFNLLLQMTAGIMPALDEII